MAAFGSQLDATVPDVARVAWDRVKAEWEDTAAHDELLRLTTLHGCYAWVAARYREVKADAGPPFREAGAARDAIAERQLDRIRRAAEVALLTSGTPRPDKGSKAYQSTKVMLGLVIVLIIIGLLYATYQRMSHSAPKQPATKRVPTPPTPPTPQVR